jgi:dolichyl-diphosphooligosaccharide--protein glycosyltransferase
MRGLLDTLSRGKGPLILIAGVTAAAAVGLRLMHYGSFAAQSSLFTYGPTELPLLSETDAYYFLDIARQALADPLGGLFGPELLSSLGALLATVGGWPVDVVAFWLPPLLAVLSVLAAAAVPLSARSTDSGSSRLAALVAGLAAAGTYYWYRRTGLGFFDTDSLNPFFVIAAGLLLAGIIRSESSRIKLACLGGLVLVGIVFALWWSVVAPAIMALFAAAYGLSIVLPSQRWERPLKVAILVGFVVAMAVLATGLHVHLPDPLAIQFESARRHLLLVLGQAGGGEGYMLPSVTESIIELQGASFFDIGSQIAGHWSIFLAGLAGFLLFCRRIPDMGVAFAPLLLLAAFSFVSSRFGLFLGFVWAIGLGWLAEELWRAGARFVRTTWLRGAVVAAVFAGLLAPTYANCLDHRLRPVYLRTHAEIARAAQELPGERIWCRWTDGYFLQYMSGKKAIIHPGTQSNPYRLLVASRPLAMADPVTAANWIRFFGQHGLDPLFSLAAQVGSPALALELLETALAGPEAAEAAYREAGLPWGETVRARLFPAEGVPVFLSSKTVHTAYWWMYFGTWDLEEGTGTHPGVLSKLVHGLGPIERIRVIRSPRGNFVIGRAYVAGGDKRAYIDHKLESGRGLVAIVGSDQALIVEPELERTLAFRLLYDKNRPEGFREIALNAVYGGLWLAESGS